MCFGKDNSAQREAEENRRREEERQALIRKGDAEIDNVFSQFDDDFYTGRVNAYLDYAKPQLEDQLSDATKELLTALSRSGLSRSSIAANKREDLQKLAGIRDREVKDKGLEFGNQARSAVSSARDDLRQQNMQMANPTLAANNAITRAQSITALPTFSPLSALFEGVTSGLATQADLERRGQAKYGNILFEPTSSGKVIK
jgi:hypothetical protein